MTDIKFLASCSVTLVLEGGRISTSHHPLSSSLQISPNSCKLSLTASSVMGLGMWCLLELNKYHILHVIIIIVRKLTHIFRLD